MGIKQPASQKRDATILEETDSQTEDQLIKKADQNPILTTSIENLLPEPEQVETRDKILTIRVKQSTYDKLTKLKESQESRYRKTLGKRVRISDSQVCSELLERILS